VPLPSTSSLGAAAGHPSIGAATVHSSGTSAVTCGSRGARGAGSAPSAQTPRAPPTCWPVPELEAV